MKPESRQSGFARAFETNNGKSNLDNIVNVYKTYSEDELKNIPLALLVPYPNHKYKLYGGSKFENLCDSIMRSGIHEPLIVNFKDNTYYILSGHNRKNALIKLYEDTSNEKFNVAPCIVKKDLDETTCKLIVQECNLVGRNFEDMDLQERCENIHEYYETVYEFYQEHKDILPKGFKTREEVGSRLGMNYKTVEMYNRIFKTFKNNIKWYSYYPIYLDLFGAYELCKLDNNFLVLIFNKLSEFDSNGINKKIKLSQLKNIVKLQAENKYSNEELLDILFNEKTNKNKTKEKKSNQEYKLPINKNFKYFDKLDKLTQEQISMLEMRLMTEMNKYFEEMESKS